MKYSAIECNSPNRHNFVHVYWNNPENMHKYIQKSQKENNALKNERLKEKYGDALTTGNIKSCPYEWKSK